MPSKIAASVGCDETTAMMYLPAALEAVRSYTHRLFLTPIHYAGKIVIADGVITIPQEHFKVSQGDTIELLNSNLNTSIMIVESVEGDSINVYDKETLSDETFNGYVVKLHFNISVSILITMLNYNIVTSSKIGVKSESLEGYSYTLNTDKSETSGGYPSSVLSALNSMRQMPGQESREYARAGLFIKQPLYG